MRGTGPAETLAAATTVAQPTSLSRSSTQEANSAATTGPTVSASASLGISAPPSAKPPSDRVSTRPRPRTAAETGNAPPAVDWHRVRRGSSAICSAYQHPAVSPMVAADPVHRRDPCSTASPVSTVSIPSDRDRAEPSGTPLIRLPSTPGDTPTAPTKLEALDDVDELQFTDSIRRFSHANWDREPQAVPTCHASMRCITIGRPQALPPDFLTPYASHKRPSLSDIQALTNTGRLHTIDDDIVLIVRNPTPPPTLDAPSSLGPAAYLLNDELVCIFMPPLMRPRVRQACHSTNSCYLGTARTLRMLERLYWLIVMNVCTRWLLRHHLKCQARKTPRLTVRWPIIFMLLPEGPGISVDYFGPLPITPRGNSYIFLAPDGFNHRADNVVVTHAEFTAGGTANLLTNEYNPSWGLSRNNLSDNGLQVCAKVSQPVYQLLGEHKLATSSYHLNGNGGAERVSHTMLWSSANVKTTGMQLPHTEFAYNKLVGAATGLAPNEVHIGRLPRLPLTVFGRSGVA